MQSELVPLAQSQVFYRLIPEMILGLTACILFLGGTWRASRQLWTAAALIGLVGAGVAHALAVFPETTGSLTSVSLFATPLVFDSVTGLVRWLAIGGGFILVLLSWDEVPEAQTADFLACLLLIVAGTSLTAASNDLVAMFLTLELVSIPTYVLLYLPRHDEPAQEAALKYFLLSVFSSAFVLFGFSYMYGLAGTTNLAALHHTLHHAGQETMPLIAQVALITVVAGLAFRIAAVPFHFYAPDVYQGTPTVAAAMLAYIPKVVGFVALVRVLGFVLPAAVLNPSVLLGADLSSQTPMLFWFLAAVTMTLGNLMALWQDNIKRLLAYSSIAHAGYMLMALASAPYLATVQGPDGIQALLFYMPAYGAMTLGAFGVISYLNTTSQKVETVDDLAGLSRSQPMLAVFLALFMFSLIGIPLTAGFTAKFLVFFGTLAVPPGEHVWLYRVLTVIAAVNAAVGGWYYLRLVAVMYLRNPILPQERRRSWAGLAALWICVILTLGLSVPPGVTWLLQAARAA